ncbi:MAG: hypothetical protein HQK52_06245 [Oligoflexia bacterium]|nr:hypothetical protein [Oligoflexia bacterium]
MRKNEIIRQREKVIPSTLSIYESKGKPVITGKISEGIASNSIIYKENHPFIFIVKEGTAKLVPITVIREKGDFFFITSVASVSDATDYVAEGSSILKDGDKVNSISNANTNLNLLGGK